MTPIEIAYRVDSGDELTHAEYTTLAQEFIRIYDQLCVREAELASIPRLREALRKITEFDNSNLFTGIKLNSILDIAHDALAMEE